MNSKKSLVLLVALAAIFMLSVAMAEAVSMTPKVMSGQLRIIHPDGKITTVTQSGQSLDLKDATKIEMVSGTAVLQIAGYMVKMQSGEQIALKVSPRTSAVSLNVLAGAVKVESPKQSWMLNTGETAMLKVGSGTQMSGMAMTKGVKNNNLALGHAGDSSAAKTSKSAANSSMSSMTMTPAANQNNLMAREKVNADATTTNATNSTVKNDTASSDEPTTSLFPPDSPYRRMAPPAAPLAAPLLVSTPIPSPTSQPVKYASPSAP